MESGKSKKNLPVYRPFDRFLTSIFRVMYCYICNTNTCM